MSKWLFPEGLLVYILFKIPEGWGSHFCLHKIEIPGRWWVLCEIPSVLGYGYFLESQNAAFRKIRVYVKQFVVRLCSETQLVLVFHFWINGIESYNLLIENLRQLIASSKECGITFYYALSPGLDILFSNSRDVQLLKKKMDQVVIVLF